MRGNDLSSELCIWKKLGMSEVRIWLMKELSKHKIGLPEVENFSLNLGDQFKSKKFKKKFKKSKNENLMNIDLIEKAMKMKIKDEKEYCKELTVERNILRRKLGDELKKNSKPYRNTMKILRTETEKVKEEYRRKYRKKIIHLKEKFRMEKEDKLDEVLEELEELRELSIFSKDKLTT